MKNPLLSLAIGFFLVLTPTLATALPGETDITPLSNKDVLAMVQNHLSEEAIINTIKTSPCTFDTFPPVLKDMKRRGVPDAVLQAMIDAPYGPSTSARSGRGAVGDEPIYHYADQLRQLGYLTPSTSSRRAEFPRRNDRARTTRTRRR